MRLPFVPNELRVRPCLAKTNRSMDQLGELPIGQVCHCQICQNAGGKIRHKTQRQIREKRKKWKKQKHFFEKIAQNAMSFFLYVLQASILICCFYIFGGMFVLCVFTMVFGFFISDIFTQYCVPDFGQKY